MTICHALGSVVGLELLVFEAEGAVEIHRGGEVEIFQSEIGNLVGHDDGK